MTDKPRYVPIPGGAKFRAEEGEGFRRYVAVIPGKGETHIEVGWSAVDAFEECVVGRVGGVPTPEIRVGHEVAPSVAWARFLGEDDRIAFQSDLYSALVSSVASGEFAGVDEVLSTWWSIAATVLEGPSRLEDVGVTDGSPGDLYDPTDAESAGGGLS